MKRERVITFLLTLILSVVLFSEALACRYNVRETGFVDLGIDSYRLFYFIDSSTPESETSQIQTIATEILECNPVSFEIVSVEENQDHPALRYWVAMKDQLLPSAVLISPLGHYLPLGRLWD